jgi:hypothetical protein
MLNGLAEPGGRWCWGGGGGGGWVSADAKNLTPGDNISFYLALIAHLPCYFIYIYICWLSHVLLRFVVAWLVKPGRTSDDFVWNIPNAYLGRVWLTPDSNRVGHQSNT